MTLKFMPRLVLPMAVLLEFATLGATLWGWWLLHERTQEEDNVHFTRLRDQALYNIDVRLKNYEAALWGGAGLWNASKNVTRNEWSAYVDTLQLDARFPGMLGIGYIHRFKKDDSTTFVESQRNDNYPDFSVKPVPNGDVTSDDHLVIAHVVPVKRNLKAIGLDIGSEINRRTAAELAAQENKAIITGVIQLVQDKKATPGYLVLVPINSSRNSQNIITSWVYAPIIGWQLFNGIIDEKSSEIAYTVFDGDPKDNNIVVASHSSETKSGPLAPINQPKDYAGRSWTIVWSTTERFKSADQGQSLTLLIAGVGLSVLLMALLCFAHRRYLSVIRSILALNTNKQRLEEDLSKTLSTAALGLWDWNVTENTTRLEGPLCHRIGQKPGLLEMESWKKVIHPEDLSSLKNATKATLKNPQLGVDVRFRIKSIDGAWIWILSRGRLCDDQRNDHIVGTMVDITDLVEKESALKESEQLARQAQAEAESATKAKAEFLATMSHEIRTPMNGVLGMTSLLSDTNLTKQQATMVDTVRVCGENLLAIINDILDFSKIEAGKVNLEHVSFHLAQIIEESTSLLAQSAHRKNLELLVAISPHMPATIVGDPNRLRQVLVNLLSNAIKFTENGHVVLRVDVATTDEARRLLKQSLGAVSASSEQDLEPVVLSIEVEDTGVGIPEDVQGKLFQPFTQADSTTTRKFGGTGLGLVICHRLIDLMHGTISITSTPGHGATFRLLLPTVPRKGPRISNDSRLTQKRALIVHGNQLARSLTMSLCQSFNLDSESATSGSTAIEIMCAATKNNKPFTWCIIDDRLSSMSAEELIQQIKDDSSLKNTIIILLSEIPSRLNPNNHITINKPLHVSGLHKALIASLTSNKEDTTIVRNDNQDQLHGRILVAEDNAINQMLIASMLRKIGLHVDVVGDGEEVLTAIKQFKYDLILMDCLMPVMDGYDATRSIRQSEAGNVTVGHIPIIALTANAMDGDREDCIACGMDDYLSKPIQTKKLHALLIKWLPSPTAL